MRVKSTPRDRHRPAAASNVAALWAPPWLHFVWSLPRSAPGLQAALLVQHGQQRGAAVAGLRMTGPSVLLGSGVSLAVEVAYALVLNLV